ncbi:hypothetical protein D3C73_1510440 [compost metagenome]
MAVVAGAVIGALATQHAPGDHDHQAAEQDHQHPFRQLVGEVDADRGKHRAEQGDQQRGAVAHQAMA